MDLHGKTILVTRPKDQAAKTIAELEAQGGRVVHIPLIEIADPSDGYRALDAAIADIDAYDWLLFTSRNAVLRFFSRPRAPAAGMLRLRVAAVGPATAALLQELDVLDPIVAEEPSSEGLLRTLEPFEMEGKRVLFPRARGGRDELVEGLQARGAEVDLVEAYRTIFPRNFDRTSFRDLMASGEIHVVHFASPSAVGRFVELMREEGLADRIGGLKLLAVGTTTASAIEAFGF